MLIDQTSKTSTSSRKALTRLATSAIALGEVTTLDHELLDNTMEGGALIAKALLASSKSSEVLSGLGDSLSVEAQDDTAELLVALLNVEVDLVGDLGALGSLGCADKEQQSHHQDNGGGEQPPEAKHDDCSIDDIQSWISKKQE